MLKSLALAPSFAAFSGIIYANVLSNYKINKKSVYPFPINSKFISYNYLKLTISFNS